jgi:hypothetical protein
LKQNLDAHYARSLAELKVLTRQRFVDKILKKHFSVCLIILLDYELSELLGFEYFGLRRVCWDCEAQDFFFIESVKRLDVATVDDLPRHPAILKAREEEALREQAEKDRKAQILADFGDAITFRANKEDGRSVIEAPTDLLLIVYGILKDALGDKEDSDAKTS